MDRSEVAIIIPAFNEELTIKKVINEIKKYGNIFVVDDCSNDNTSKYSIKSGAFVIRNEKNLGYEKSIDVGFKFAVKNKNIKVIITYDGDDQFNPNDIPLFLQHIDNGADIVIGKRKKMQRFSESIFSFYTQFKYHIKDPLCGLKAYKVWVYDELGYFDSYRSTGTELLLFALKISARLKEQKIDIKKRMGEAKFGSGIKPNLHILRSLIFAIVRFDLFFYKLYKK